MTHDLARERERVLVRDGVVVGDAGAARVEGCASELLRRHVFARGGFHERWAADEDRAGALDDHRLVAHRRDVGTAGGARAHHDGDLGDVLRRQSRLVVEDPAEVVAVGEHVGLEGEERAARVDEVDAREVVLLGDLLGAEVLLDGEREVRASLDGGVVRDDDAAAALDRADARDDPGRRGLSVVYLPGREGVELEECGAGVDEQVDALPRRELAARAVALGRRLTAACCNERRPLAQLGTRGPCGRARAANAAEGIDSARQHRHPPPSFAGTLARVRVGADVRHDGIGTESSWASRGGGSTPVNEPRNVTVRAATPGHLLRIRDTDSSDLVHLSDEAGSNGER